MSHYGFIGGINQSDIGQHLKNCYFLRKTIVTRRVGRVRRVKSCQKRLRSHEQYDADYQRQDESKYVKVGLSTIDKRQCITEGLFFFSEKDDEKLRNAWKRIWSLLKTDQGDYFTCCQLLPIYKACIEWSINKRLSSTRYILRRQENEKKIQFYLTLRSG